MTPQGQFQVGPVEPGTDGAVPSPVESDQN